MVGLPWGRWKRLSETDAGLMFALSVYEGSLCGCGCGQWAQDAHDPDTDGEWEVIDDDFCYAGAALEEWQKENAGDAEPGQLIRLELFRGVRPVRYQPPGVKGSD